LDHRHGDIMTATLLSVAQSKQVNAAAALLRASDREQFLRDVTEWLGRFPSDGDVTQAIHAVLGIKPTIEPIQNGEALHD
jgi:hypothetical protein